MQEWILPHATPSAVCFGAAAIIWAVDSALAMRHLSSTSAFDNLEVYQSGAGCRHSLPVHAGGTACRHTLPVHASGTAHPDCLPRSHGLRDPSLSEINFLNSPKAETRQNYNGVVALSLQKGVHCEC
jgi:hypothetical protein